MLNGQHLKCQKRVSYRVRPKTVHVSIPRYVVVEDTRVGRVTKDVGLGLGFLEKEF